MLSNPKTADELYYSNHLGFLSTGCKNLDQLLGGGIPLFPVTEITGPAGVGKSQLLLALALTVQLPQNLGGLESSCVYLSTEGRVPANRLLDFLTTSPELHSLLTEHITTDDVLNRIYIDDQIVDADSLWYTMKHRLPNILVRNPNIKLCIIDSITHIFRGEFMDRTVQTMMERNNWFFGLTGFMKQLHDQFGCYFILSNQVTTDMSTGRIKPALGMAWSSCVNQRFMLDFNDQHDEDATTAKRKRRFSVVFSPSLACGVYCENMLVGTSGLRIPTVLNV